MKDICSNKYVTIFSNAIIQTVIIFIFLTIFFFSYVSGVEKTEFESQLNFITDSVYSRHKKEINDALDRYSINEDKRRYIKTAIYGTIDYNEEEMTKKSQQENKNIEQTNNKIKEDSIFYVKALTIIAIVILFIIFIIMHKKYDCYLPLGQYFKEGIIVLFFIFVVEIIFLNVVVKNYISANPNEIKNKIAASIINYIDNKGINK